MQLITLNISRCVHCEHMRYRGNGGVECSFHLKMTTINDTCNDFKTANWIKKELALTENELNDGNEPDDTSDHSDDEIHTGLVDSSMSSIQINRELTKGTSYFPLSKFPISLKFIV